LLVVFRNTGSPAMTASPADTDSTRLIYVETTADIWEALAREKQIKGWRRDKKSALITAQNPRWEEVQLA
jgi:predicted GIY-YIG superfamily endonuclease